MQIEIVPPRAQPTQQQLQSSPPRMPEMSDRDYSDIVDNLLRNISLMQLGEQIPQKTRTKKRKVIKRIIRTIANPSFASEHSNSTSSWDLLHFSIYLN